MNFCLDIPPQGHLSTGGLRNIINFQTICGCDSEIMQDSHLKTVHFNGHFLQVG